MGVTEDRVAVVREMAAAMEKYCRHLTGLDSEVGDGDHGTNVLTILSRDGRVSLTPYTTYGTEELSGHAAEALGETHNACLLQNHGTITVGESPEKAFSLTVILEEMAQIYYQTRLAGEPILLSPAQVEEVATKIAGYGQAKQTSADTE